MNAEETKIKHYYLHADLDAFFASVEQLDHPEYRGKPVIVGGKPEDKRSVVSTASYEARVFGVHSAMPTAKAYQLCPQGIFVHGRMKRYSELSYQIMQIFSDFSPDVQQMSIDEAFIDLTGTEKLFGPPEQTAYKIKERVKKETGLTVSIGLAPTKYLAKLASDMKKPDGFYMIEEGTEEQFMLNLPLKKVWGIGDKTYEALKMAGLKTTRDIHEKSLEALSFMFGQNTGSFLYNVVRGIETVTFDRKTKSHSISNEATFPFDLTDIYTAETAMLDLCHSVIFRLLKENGFSRTVQVKIRYEDFSTVSIQQTYPQSVLTLDALYEAAKELFEKKYERGRGIRLLGIALENIEATERTYQPGLFDDNNEKKQNVEKAILKLEKKHPEIKIHKARMLEKLNNGAKLLITVSAICFLSSLFSLPLTAQEQKTELSEETSNYEISGSWKGTMKGSIDSTFGMGNAFGLSAAPPVFDTEVDLSALINITPNFYFQLEFLDKFKNNTYTIGYNGERYLNLFKFSNRNITFPTEYSSTLNGYSIGGGKNEAPGIMLHFDDYEQKKWKGDFLLRYDMTEQKTALFYGNNSVQDVTTELNNYVTSNTFVIPSQAVFHIRDIYIQSNNGSYKTSDGMSFYRLSSQDYIIDSSKKILQLSDSLTNVITPETVPFILITFDDDSFCNILLSDTGNYSDSSTFAGQVQSLFKTSIPELELSDYSSLDYDSVTKTINDSTAFVIQSPQNFLPYICANKYKINANTSSQYFIQNKDKQTTESSYSVRLQNDFYFSSTDFLDEKQYYAQVQNLNYKNSDYLSAEYRFPFADKYPLIYLQSKSEQPLALVQRNLTPVKQFDIGKKASAGTVRVYKNGVLLTDAVYDSNTGFVSLNEQVNELDTIYIVYQEENSDSSKGFVTTGTGFSYNILPSLVFDTSFTGKYQAGNSIEELSKTSFSTITNGITYKGKNLTVYDAVSTGIETQKELSNSLVTKNQAGITFENEQAFVQAISSQGLALNTSTGKKASDYINTNLKGSYEIAGIKAGADAALAYISLQTAGHSLTTTKPLFKLFDFGEIYRFSKNELEKKDYISFTSSPFIFSAQTTALNTELANKQNYLAETKVSIKAKQTTQAFNLKFSEDQQKDSDINNLQAFTPWSNYFTGWYEISNNQFTKGNSNSVRNTDLLAQYKSSYNFAKLSPDLSLELTGKNLNTEQKEFLTSDLLQFIVPFSTLNNAFSFTLIHKGIIQANFFNAQNYKDDIKQLFKTQKDLDFLYTAIPFYSLFDSGFKTKIQNKTFSAEGALEYDFAWRRNLFNNLKDLFIPVSTTAGISRNIVHTANKTTDTYQIKGKVSSNYVNSNQEYTGFISTVFKFNPFAKALPYYQISSGEMFTLYFEATNTLNLNADFYFDNYKNWNFKTSAVWSRSTNKSLLLELTHLCWKESNTLNLSPKVKDSCSISFSTQNKIHKEVYSYLRSSEITFLTHFNLNSAAGISFGYEQGKTFRLGLNYELGMKILF